MGKRERSPARIPRRKYEKVTNEPYVFNGVQCTHDNHFIGFMTLSNLNQYNYPYVETNQTSSFIVCKHQIFHPGFRFEQAFTCNTLYLHKQLRITQDVNIQSLVLIFMFHVCSYYINNYYYIQNLFHIQTTLQGTIHTICNTTYIY